MLAPIVNLNGDRGVDLLAAATDAATALDRALVALAAIAPHGRNYQLQPRGSLVQASQDYRALYARLGAVRDEVQALATNISQQVKK